MRQYWNGLARSTAVFAVGFFVVALVVPLARADLMITPAGQARGLRLTTFAYGFPTSGDAGPLGVAFNRDGSVTVSDGPGNVRRFATDADGQDARNAAVGHYYGTGNAHDLAQHGATIYMTQFPNNDIVQINPDGTIAKAIATALAGPLGLAVNPANGHLLVAEQTQGRVSDIDPATGARRFFASAPGPDGVSISPDGTILYVAAAGSGHVLGFNVDTGAQVFDSGPIPGGIDGTAAGAGLFGNDLFVNLNNGTLIDINLTTRLRTVIADGGSRGDYVTVDPTNDTLMITQTDRIMRLNGATFAVPEPSSLALLVLGSVVLLGWRSLCRAAWPGSPLS
jgi:DNA-binding beta-propeller fold protein YncE